MPEPKVKGKERSRTKSGRWRKKRSDAGLGSVDAKYPERRTPRRGTSLWFPPSKRDPKRCQKCGSSDVHVCVDCGALTCMKCGFVWGEKNEKG